MPHPSTIAEPCNTAPTPQPFLQVFENGASYVVVSFDTDAAVEEGDVTEYMNELARLNSVPGSWQLCKSAPHWGLVQVLPPIIAMHAPQWTHRSFIHSFHFIHSFIHFIHSFIHSFISFICDTYAYHVPHVSQSVPQVHKWVRSRSLLTPT